MENKLEHEMAIECLEWFIGIKGFGKFGIPLLVPTIRTMSYIGGCPIYGNTLKQVVVIISCPLSGLRVQGSGSPGVLCSGIGANSQDAALISLV